jgi:hypothetical protein
VFDQLAKQQEQQGHSQGQAGAEEVQCTPTLPF